MGASAPKQVIDLVERFERNRKVFLSADYKEEQLRAEFLNPFFESLGWDAVMPSARALHADRMDVLGKVIRLAAGHQAKVEEQSEDHASARAFDNCLQLT